MDEKSPPQAVHTSSDAFPDAELHSLAPSDKLVMLQMGKLQQLKRRFNLFSIFGLSITLLSSWEAIGGVFGIALTAGGPLSLVWGYLFVWTGTMACALSIAEMASICPISGSQYHWTYVFAPERWKVFVSFIQGEWTLGV